MNFYTHLLKDSEPSEILAGSQKLTVPLVEIRSVATIPIEELKDKKSRENRVIEALNQVMEDLQKSFDKLLNSVVEIEPLNNHLIILMRTPPICLSADQIGRNIYENEEWDVELEKMIHPEDSQIIGRSPTAMGWVLFSVLGVASTPEAPLGITKIFEKPALKFDKVENLSWELFRSPDGRAKISKAVSDSIYL